MKSKQHHRRNRCAALCGLAVLTLAAGAAAAEREKAAVRPRPASVSVGAVTKELSGSTAILRSDINATLPAGQVIDIDNPYGDVHARFGGFEHRLEAHVVLQEPDGAAHIDLKPLAHDAEKRFSLAPRLPAGATVREGQRLDLSVLVPEGHALRVRTEHGLISVRGVRGDLDAVSVDGNIDLRGIRGAIQARTGGGAIEASLGSAPRGSTQRLATTTGAIRVGVDDHLDAELHMATASQFATDYSLTITRRPGEEPDKVAQALIGENHAKVMLESARGEIRLLRRASFTTAGDSATAAAQAGKEEEQEDNDSD